MHPGPRLEEHEGDLVPGVPEGNKPGGVGTDGPMLAVQSGGLGWGVGVACAEQLPPRYPNSSPGAADIAVHSGGG